MFICLAIPNAFYNFFSGTIGQIHPWIELMFAPATFGKLFFKFWTAVTYMFTHIGFWHIVNNMLILYIGGRIYEEVLGRKRLLNTYFLGGFAGLILFILAFTFVPSLQASSEVATIHGASAAVIAVVVAIATYTPNFVIRLLLLGPVKLIYIALFLVLLSFLALDSGNSGGAVAHLGGALWGFLYASSLKRGKDIGRWFDQFVNSLAAAFRPKPKIRVEYSNPQKPPRDDYDYNEEKKRKQESIDAILDKISKSGYDSLTKKEKDLLFKASGKK